MKTPTILVSCCYSEVTPESAVDGAESDSGFVFEAEPMTFRQLVSQIKSGFFVQQGATDWLECEPYVSDYSTGTYRSESLHLAHGNKASAEKWFWLAARFAGACSK